MTKITIPDTADLLARIAELEAELKDANRRAAMQGIYTDRQQCRAQRAEAALSEIIMEATSRNHAIDIARRARHGDDKKTSQDAK